MSLRRDFVDTPEVQLHVVTAGPAAGTATPLVMIPQMSAFEQVRLMEALGERPTVAIDPLGLGDSDPAPWSNPTMGDYAGVLLTALSALKIDQFDLYGSHFGARAATEMAVKAPKTGATSDSRWCRPYGRCAAQRSRTTLCPAHCDRSAR